MSESSASEESARPGGSRPIASARLRGKKRSWGKWVFGLVILAVAAVGGWWYFKHPKETVLDFRTATVARGDIVQEVTANGALSPVKNVEVGSQVSGIINKIKVDFNSHVKEGEVIAQIDPSTFQQNLNQAE